MNCRAVLCDIYNTLLEVGPPPAEAEQRWEQLCRALPSGVSRLSLDEFAAATERIIAREHAAAKASGIAHPEIFWPAVARVAWPALALLDGQVLDEFLFQHAQLQRTVRLMPGAAEALGLFAKRNLCLGLVSNSQPYTLRELDAALAPAAVSRALFSPDLCFFSFEHGFSKPDPHVFRWLTARLAQRGITPGQAFVVGDREDNDLAPAQATGFRTWLLTARGIGAHSGDWRALCDSVSAA